MRSPSASTTLMQSKFNRDVFVIGCGCPFIEKGLGERSLALPARHREDDRYSFLRFMSGFSSTIFPFS